VLSKSGEIYFELNPESWGYYTLELGEFFRRRGARVEGKKVRFTVHRSPFGVHRSRAIGER
jgi:hypothetical protein